MTEQALQEEAPQNEQPENQPNEPQENESPPVSDDAPAPDGDGNATVLDSTKDGDEPIKAAADFPADWREKLAGEDEAMKKQLDRYGSVKDAIKAGYEAQQKLRAGSHKKAEAPGEDASDEEKAAYREQVGVPAKPEDYKIELSDGLVVGEDDKPYVDEMLNVMHEKNVPQDLANQLMDSYFHMQTQQIEAQATMDREVAGETVEELRAEYGPEYKANISHAKALLTNQFGEEMAVDIMSARTGENGEGPRLGDTADFNRGILAMAKIVMPGSTVVPNSDNPGKAISDELAELQKRVGSPEWFSDAPAQARYQELLEAQESYK